MSSSIWIKVYTSITLLWKHEYVMNINYNSMNIQTKQITEITVWSRVYRPGYMRYVFQNILAGSKSLWISAFWNNDYLCKNGCLWQTQMPIQPKCHNKGGGSGEWCDTLTGARPRTQILSVPRHRDGGRGVAPKQIVFTILRFLTGVYKDVLAPTLILIYVGSLLWMLS